MCAHVRLKRIITAEKLNAQKSVLKFKHSRDIDGRIADLSGSGKSSESYYQIHIETTPGDAKFEATIRHDGAKFKVDFKSVSRINIYGDQPACITKEYPHLRPYCFCQ